MARAKQENHNTPADGTLPQLDEMASAANLMAAVQAGYSDQQRQVTQLIGERIGRRSMAQMITKLLTVTDLLDLQRIKESKQYKGFVHVDEQGNRQSISTWDEYCILVEGRSRQAVDLDLQNLTHLGPDLFDSMRRIGIGPGTMRDIRQLPDDDKAVIAEVVKTDNKDEIVELIDGLTAKHAKDKEEAKRQLAAKDKQFADLKADYDAQSKVLADANSKRDALKMELAKLTDITPEAQEAERQRIESTLLKQLQAEAGKLLGSIQPFAQVVATCLDQAAPESALQAATESTVQWLFQRIDEIAKANLIPVDFAETVTPSWMQPAGQLIEAGA